VTFWIVVLSELMFTVTGPCAVVKVKMLPLICVMMPLAPRRAPVRGDLGFAGVAPLDGVGGAP
jgi:hypothetical protein